MAAAGSPGARDGASEAGSTALGSRASELDSSELLADDARYDVFVSHCKRLDASEDRAVWVADVCEGAGLKVFFDRSDLTDISEEVLERSVKESRVVVTVLDPHTFESDWVVKENRWAAEAGRPILPIYDGDRHRWNTIKKWCGSHPHVFAKQAINYNKDYRAESKQRLLDAVVRALGEGRAVERPPIAHAVQEEPTAPAAPDTTPQPTPIAPGGMAYRDSTIGGTYDGPSGLHCVIVATADPNVVQALGSWGSGRPSLVCEMVRSSTSPLVWNGVLPPQLFGGAPIRWEFEPGLGAFTSTAGGKPTTHYVKRGASETFDIEEGREDPALRNGRNWARICCPLGGDAGACNGYKGVGAAYHEPIGCCWYTRPPYKDKPDHRETRCYCVFWLVVFCIGQVPLGFLYAAIGDEKWDQSVQQFGYIYTTLGGLFLMSKYLLPAWLVIAVCIVWCGIAERVFCMPYCTNISMCPCTVHRVTPYFARKYPHLVTRGPAAQR